ncbi:MAG: DUF3373 family protein [Thermodesulfobacteriota bacterium]
MQLGNTMVRILVCLGFVLYATTGFAQQDVDKGQGRDNSLKRQVDHQKPSSKELKGIVEKQQQQIKKLRQDIARVYRQTMQDTGRIERYKLGNSAYLRASYYDMTRENERTRSEAYENAFVNYFDLKFWAMPSAEVKFNATLTMYKLWGAWNTPEDVGNADFSYSAKPSDAAVRAKRAYVDYRPEWLNRAVNFTFGRLPTSGGDLTKYRYNRPSQTTYPDLAFNAESDGAALTFYLERLPVADTLNLVYARSEDDTDARPFAGDDNALEDIDFYSVQLNSQLPFVDDAELALQWFRVDNVRPTGDDVIREKFDELSRMAALGRFGPLDLDTPVFPDSLGYVDKYTVQFEKEKVFDWPLDVFASVAWSRSKPNGKRVSIGGEPLEAAVEDQLANENLPESFRQDLQRLSRLPETLYLVSPDNQQSQSGNAFYAGLRYHVASERFNQPKIGVEYFDGSQYWVGLNIAALDPFQKLNTRGQVWELYWVQPLVRQALQMRTGYQAIDRDYTQTMMSGLYGAPQKTDESDELLYLSLEYTF